MTVKYRMEMAVRAVMAAVQADLEHGIPFRHPKKNSGEALIHRINLRSHFTVIRRGDVQYVRALYSSMRKLVELHNPDEAEKP